MITTLLYCVIFIVNNFGTEYNINKENAKHIKSDKTVKGVFG